ncbi:GNAT family N-acetyltransferase [Streptomyces sp. NPDC090306]|uniref:GNAT family N-acetyltransferase n=1 Tax=Streptomyces sp. NPDC090306 TaxID=3365961 RepID=UPI0038294249
MKPATVRPFEDDDLAGAAEALTAVHASDGYPVEGIDDPKAWIRSADVLAAWVAEADGQIVGHVSVMRAYGEDAVAFWTEQSGEPATHVAVLARLFVVREARKQALGERLVQAAVSHARAHGLRLVLDVMTKDRSAMRLYERLGWREIGRASHRYGADQSIDAVCYVSPDA